jgi:hypothetical protein
MTPFPWIHRGFELKKASEIGLAQEKFYRVGLIPLATWSKWFYRVRSWHVIDDISGLDPLELYDGRFEGGVDESGLSDERDTYFRRSFWEYIEQEMIGPRGCEMLLCGFADAVEDGGVANVSPNFAFEFSDSPNNILVWPDGQEVGLADPGSTIIIDDGETVVSVAAVSSVGTTPNVTVTITK